MSVYPCFPPYLSLLSCVVRSSVAPWHDWLQTPGLPSVELRRAAAILTVTRPCSRTDNFVEMTGDKRAVTDTCISCNCLSHLDSFDALRPYDVTCDRESCRADDFHFFLIKKLNTLSGLRLCQQRVVLNTSKTKD